jgi:hypothetical protein
MRCAWHLIVIWLLPALSGCVVPTSTGDPEPFTDESLSFLKTGETTRAQVRAEMLAFAVDTPDGDFRVTLNPLEFEDGRLWLYAMPRGEVSLLLAEPPNPMLLSGGGVAETGHADYRYLLIRFDETNVLAGYERSESEGKGCNAQGVCANGPAYMLLASRKEDLEARQFRPPPGQCGIYFYATKVREGAPVWLNQERAGWLVNSNTFVYWAVDPGAYRVSSQSTDGRLKPAVELDCKAGGLHFIELRQKGILRANPVRTEVSKSDEKAGMSAIKSRKRLLVPGYPQ